MYMKDMYIENIVLRSDLEALFKKHGLPGHCNIPAEVMVAYTLKGLEALAATQHYTKLYAPVNEQVPA
jgi:hypothetical protein